MTSFNFTKHHSRCSEIVSNRLHKLHCLWMFGVCFADVLVVSVVCIASNNGQSPIESEWTREWSFTELSPQHLNSKVLSCRSHHVHVSIDYCGRKKYTICEGQKPHWKKVKKKKQQQHKNRKLNNSKQHTESKRQSCVVENLCNETWKWNKANINSTVSIRVAFNRSVVCKHSCGCKCARESTSTAVLARENEKDRYKRIRI